MIKKQNKKALSEVIATVLILLITVTAAVILADFVIPFVRDNLTKSTECVNYKNYFDFDTTTPYNCFDSNGDYYISVQAIGDPSLANNVAGISISMVNGDGTSNVLYIKNGTSVDNITQLDSANPSLLTVPLPGETRTYNLSMGSSSDINSSSIDVLLNSGSVCEQSTSLTFVNCQGD